MRASVPWAEMSGGVRYLVMPHPSGVSHFWNVPKDVHRAAAAFRASLRVAGLLPDDALPLPLESLGDTKLERMGASRNAPEHRWRYTSSEKKAQAYADTEPASALESGRKAGVDATAKRKGDAVRRQRSRSPRGQTLEKMREAFREHEEMGVMDVPADALVKQDSAATIEGIAHSRFFGNHQGA